MFTLVFIGIIILILLDLKYDILDLIDCKKINKLGKELIVNTNSKSEEIIKEIEEVYNNRNKEKESEWKKLMSKVNLNGKIKHVEYVKTKKITNINLILRNNKKDIVKNIIRVIIKLALIVSISAIFYYIKSRGVLPW